MGKTLTELSKEIGRELGMLNANEEWGAEDDTYVKSVIADELQSLPGNGVNVFWDYDDTPQEVFRPLARYLATCLPAFGIVFEDAKIEQRLNKLRGACRMPYMGETLETVYY